MSRYVYHVEAIGAAGVSDCGIFGTLTRARREARREECTRRLQPERIPESHYERWVSSDELLDEFGNPDEFVQITRRPLR